ncbi:uncharacterized protein LOC141655111 [Silene latifolia]|uniref:uncharacterized protein LOC141655111 n=1 Tax=Silene latifolia TaxID=37657 RepID=UPI003D78AA79
MGSLATHFCTFLFLFSIGFRRLYCSFSLYLKDPSLYRSKPWFFINPNWKNIDFYTLLIALPIISFSDIFLFLSFSGYPSYRFAFLQHGTLIFLFWVLLILIILRESFDLCAINEGFVYVLGGVCFLVEYLINGNGFDGVASNVYDMLDHLTLVCAFSCLYLSIRPTAFVADFYLSSGLMFKGTWSLQVGLNLYTETFGLKGCHTVSLLPGNDKVDINCVLDVDGLRGVALMNLLFVCHAIVVLITCFGLFWLLSRKEGLRFGEGTGSLLPRIESRGMLLQPLPELEMD